MRILILGGGEVGSTVAKTLANQAGNTITIIDQDESIIQSLNDI